MLLQFLATASRLPVFFSYTATEVLHLFLISKQFLEKTLIVTGYLVLFYLYIAKLTLSLSLDCGIRNHYRWHLGCWICNKNDQFL